MAFAIAKGFGLHETFRQRLMEDFAGQKEVLNYVFSFSDSLLQNTDEGIIAGFGIFFLLDGSKSPSLSNFSLSFSKARQ